MEVNNPCSLLGAPNPVEPLFFRAPAILASSLSLSLSRARGASWFINLASLFLVLNADLSSPQGPR